MVIIGNKSGKLGNRLFVFAHLIANAIEHSYGVSNPSFYDYSHYFANMQDDFFCRYPARKSRLKSRKFLQNLYLKTLNGSVGLCRKMGFRLLDCDLLKVTANGHDDDNYHLSSPQFIAKREASRHLLVKGWAIRDFPNLEKHADHVRRFFEPAQPHIANISRLMEKAREDCDLLVGVHIRQGDYKKWLNGKYFFSSEEYASIMRRYCSQENRKVKFLICSNTPQDPRDFVGLNYLTGNNHQLEDMYSFAQCDLLIGPPSTYTMWASFYGSVPLFTVDSAEGPVSANGFKVCRG